MAISQNGVSSHGSWMLDRLLMWSGVRGAGGFYGEGPLADAIAAQDHTIAKVSQVASLTTGGASTQVGYVKEVLSTKHVLFLVGGMAVITFVAIGVFYAMYGSVFSKVGCTQQEEEKPKTAESTIAVRGLQQESGGVKRPINRLKPIFNSGTDCFLLTAYRFMKYNYPEMFQSSAFHAACRGGQEPSSPEEEAKQKSYRALQAFDETYNSSDCVQREDSHTLREALVGLKIPQTGEQDAHEVLVKLCFPFIPPSYHQAGSLSPEFECTASLAPLGEPGDEGMDDPPSLSELTHAGLVGFSPVALADAINIRCDRFLSKDGQELKNCQIVDPEGGILDLGELGVYEVTGFIKHQGGAARFGHYVAYQKVDGEWYALNNQDVTKVRNNSALQKSIGGTVLQRPCDKDEFKTVPRGTSKGITFHMARAYILHAKRIKDPELLDALRREKSCLSKQKEEEKGSSTSSL